eukprot:1089757-Alexandrium_andersonii.AAC.1
MIRKTQCCKCLTAGIKDPNLRSHLFRECPMPIILRDAEAELRWCQNCHVCGKYHRSDKCPKLGEMPRRLAYESRSPKECIWAI